MKTNTKKLVILSLLICLSIVLTRFFSIMVPVLGSNTVRVGLGSIPIMISGILFGPIAGLTVGALSDFLGVIMFSPFPLYPGFTLSAALVGFISGLYRKTLRKNPRVYKFILLSYSIEIPVSIFLNTFWLTQITSISYVALLIPRSVSGLILALVYALILFALCKALFKLEMFKPKL